MSIEYPVLPFKIEDVYAGFANCMGLLVLKQNKLVLEFQTKDTFFGVIKSGIRDVTLSIRQIQSVEFQSKLFSSKVIITSYSMKFLKDIPGAESTRVVLRIEKRNKEIARKLVSRINFMIAEAKLEDLDS